MGQKRRGAVKVVSETELKAKLAEQDAEDNQRRDLRIPARLNIELSLTADELRKAYTANISKGGLMFTIERPVTIPATVSCTLSLPDGQTVELSGEVRHVEPSRTSNECEVGVQFKALDPAVQATLEKSVAAFAARK